MTSLNLQKLDLAPLQSDKLITSIHANAEYNATHDDMLSRVLARIDDKKNNKTHADELWLVEHQDVYTLGQAGKESIFCTKQTRRLLKPTVADR